MNSSDPANSHYLSSMGIFRLPLFFVLILIGSLLPVRAYSVHNNIVQEEKKEVKDNKKMDVLSLVAHIVTVAGVASFFVVPPASLVILPVAFILGAIAFLGGKKRYENRRGKGLALTALAIGGAFTVVIFGSLLAFAIFGF